MMPFPKVGSAPLMPPGSPRLEPAKPSQLSPPPRPKWAVRQCVWSLAEAENDRVVVFTPGTSFVSRRMKPPEKSAGYSGAGDFTIWRLSIWLLGMMSKLNARLSGSELGTAAPLIHTLL